METNGGYPVPGLPRWMCQRCPSHIFTSPTRNTLSVYPKSAHPSKATLPSSRKPSLINQPRPTGAFS